MMVLEYDYNSRERNKVEINHIDEINRNWTSVAHRERGGDKDDS